jgi:hypothetical protein
MKFLQEFTFSAVHGFAVAANPDRQQDQMEEINDYENDGDETPDGNRKPSNI